MDWDESGGAGGDRRKRRRRRDAPPKLMDIAQIAAAGPPVKQ